MSRYPELPPKYTYRQENQRVYVQDPKGNYLRVTRGKRQYWHQHTNAALAAWKHAYEELKKELLVEKQESQIDSSFKTLDACQASFQKYFGGEK